MFPYRRYDDGLLLAGPALPPPALEQEGAGQEQPHSGGRGGGTGGLGPEGVGGIK